MLHVTLIIDAGLMGNSEVGHLNIGAGRVVYQDIVRIDLAVKNHELHKVLILFLSNVYQRFAAGFFSSWHSQQPAMAASFKRAKETNGRLHLIGLVSDGGVHSHQNHLYEIVQQAHAFGIPNIYIHFFADGRDTSPKSAVGYLKKLQEELKARAPGTASIATMTGRYADHCSSSVSSHSLDTMPWTGTSAGNAYSWHMMLLWKERV